MKPSISIQNINNCSATEFINTLGSIFEHSPWVAELACAGRPFDSVDSLLVKMKSLVNAASHHQRHTLICNHPELAGQEAQQDTLTTESKNEQAAAGLNNCSREELQKLRSLNKQYREKFGFPFVIAVKNLSRQDILDAMQTRLQNTKEIEFDSCIQQIGKIAEFRLKQLIEN